MTLMLRAVRADTDCLLMAMRRMNWLQPMHVFDLIEVVFEMWRDAYDSTRSHLLNLFACVGGLRCDALGVDGEDGDVGCCALCLCVHAGSVTPSAMA